MFVDSFPGTISFNIDSPFQPFILSLQVKFASKLSPIKFFVTTSTQRDFQCQGASRASTVYLRNEIISNIDALFQINFLEKSLVGVGANYKKLLQAKITQQKKR